LKNYTKSTEIQCDEHHKVWKCNVMNITAPGGGPAAIWRGKWGTGQIGKRPLKPVPQLQSPKRPPDMSIRLPDLAVQVKASHIAVPQIEHNWTSHVRHPKKT
jgi:hypothetical protein